VSNLILTGWGYHDYACAAAVVLRKSPDSEVQGKSMARMTETMVALADDREAHYDNIFILGIPWRGEPSEILKALKMLHSSGTKITWISCYPIALWLPEKINKYIQIYVDDTANLTTITGKYLKVKFLDLLPIVSKNAYKGDVPWSRVLDMAMFYYRAYQNPKIYAQVINDMALGYNHLPEHFETMLNHYKKYEYRELIGNSQAIQDLREQINKIGPKDCRVLIQGESGTGKETVAVQLHFKSQRKEQPLIYFNCATLNVQLLESGWFGHSKNAFTGAGPIPKDGVFIEADGGTLFLDEIGDLPLEVQGVLLRVLQEGRFNRLGDNKEYRVNVRVIAATNRHLSKMVAEGKFREDLFHRLCVVPIVVAPLREHPEDIAIIANAYWRTNNGNKTLSQKQIEILERYHWPGNVRELHNFLERALVLEESNFESLLEQHKVFIGGTDNTEKEKPEKLDELIKQHAQSLLKKYKGNISQTAQAMGITRNTLKKYIKEDHCND